MLDYQNISFKEWRISLIYPRPLHIPLTALIGLPALFSWRRKHDKDQHIVLIVFCISAVEASWQLNVPGRPVRLTMAGGPLPLLPLLLLLHLLQHGQCHHCSQHPPVCLTGWRSYQHSDCWLWSNSFVMRKSPRGFPETVGWFSKIIVCSIQS